MTCRDLRSQAGLPEPVGRAMPEGDDVGPHPRRLAWWTLGSGPGARGRRLCLIGVDRGLLLHGEADVVEPVQQAVLAERIDLELHRAAVGAADLLLGEIDAQRRIGAALGIVEQFVEVVLGEADRQNAVLDTIIVEDVAVRGRYHAVAAESMYLPRLDFSLRAP